jgi:uncharacterized protein (DUF2336 family)
MDDKELTELLALAREKSASGRKTLMDAVSDLFCEQDNVLSDRERALMTDILHQLVHDVEMSVRRTLAERLAVHPQAPRELIVELANDQIEVAHPILMGSHVLHDTDLVEIIHHRTLEHQLAIAMRKNINESVTDALVESGNEDVVKAMLENPSARVSRATMEYLVEQSKRVDTYQNPLLKRPELEPALAKRMYLWVSAALRTHIVSKFTVDSAALGGPRRDHRERDRGRDRQPPGEPRAPDQARRARRPPDGRRQEHAAPPDPASAPGRGAAVRGAVRADERRARAPVAPAAVRAGR